MAPGQVCSACSALHSCLFQLAAVTMHRPAFLTPLSACGSPHQVPPPNLDPVLTICWAPGVNNSSHPSCHRHVGGSGRIRIPCRGREDE